VILDLSKTSHSNIPKFRGLHEQGYLRGYWKKTVLVVGLLSNVVKPFIQRMNFGVTGGGFPLSAMFFPYVN